MNRNLAHINDMLVPDTLIRDEFNTRPKELLARSHILDTQSRAAQRDILLGGRGAGRCGYRLETVMD